MPQSSSHPPRLGEVEQFSTETQTTQTMMRDGEDDVVFSAAAETQTCAGDLDGILMQEDEEANKDFFSAETQTGRSTFSRSRSSPPYLIQFSQVAC